MLDLTITFYNTIRAFFYSVWGLTIFDLIPIIDFDFLDGVDERLKTVVAILGTLYFIVQIVFKIIELNHKRKYNKGLRKLQKEEIEMREKENDYVNLRKDFFKGE